MYRSIFILFNPRIQISAMQMHPASHPHYGEIALENQVLNGLLCASQIHRSLLDVQQNGLNIGRSEASKLQPKQRRHFAGHCAHQH